MASRVPEVERALPRAKLRPASKLGALTAMVVGQLVEFEVRLDEDVATGWEPPPSTFWQPP